MTLFAGIIRGLKGRSGQSGNAGGREGGREGGEGSIDGDDDGSAPSDDLAATPLSKKVERPPAAAGERMGTRVTRENKWCELLPKINLCPPRAIKQASGGRGEKRSTFHRKRENTANDGKFGVVARTEQNRTEQKEEEEEEERAIYCMGPHPTFSKWQMK